METGVNLGPAQDGAVGDPDPEVLLPRVARGDAAAFEHLYDTFSAAVHGVARRIVRDPGLAEDVTQDVFLEVWRKAPRFDETRGSARTWVLTIAHRRAVDAVRRNESLKRCAGQSGIDPVSMVQPDDALLQAEERAAVRGGLGTLTALQLEAVDLAYFGGHTYAEVATLLGKPLPTVKTRVRDGLLRLRTCLEGT